MKAKAFAYYFLKVQVATSYQIVAMFTTQVNVIFTIIYCILFTSKYFLMALAHRLKILNFVRSEFGILIASNYHKNVLDHYENPRNVGSLDKSDPNVGTGVVGAPACGDVMKLQIKVDENGRITDAKFKTFGCCSAIASSSLATEWIKGKSVEEALQVTNHEIAAELRLPPVKLHCSMLAEEAISAALNDYKRYYYTASGKAAVESLSVVACVVPAYNILWNTYSDNNTS
ncbi:Iron-sulfur cluster assembly enzyme ISCU [Trichinella pseudospiralis]